MIDNIIKEYQTKINARLDILTMPTGQHYDAVNEAMRHSLLSGGKRIRPIILLEFYKLFGGDDDCAYNFACALEMIHTYSLIHDDLPCMDNDDMRRGKPSCHKAFGEDMALLAGDALLTEAFSAAAKTNGISADRIVNALIQLSSYAGINGMIGGQVIDLKNSDYTACDLIKEMYSLKTAALIKAACVCGAILAGADEENLKKCSEYGECVGIAFQIIDDFLDKNANENVFGKPVGSDEKNDKKTLLRALGEDEAMKTAVELTKRAGEILEVFDGDTEILKELTDKLLRRKF